MTESDRLKASQESNSTLAEVGAWTIVGGLLFEICVSPFMAGARAGPLPLASAIPNAVIALGVVGEIVFGRRASAATDSLKSLSDLQVAEANVRAAAATERAEKVEVERLKLEALLAPRRLSEAQRARIAKHFEPWSTLPGTDKKQSAAVFPSNLRDFESTRLANEIAEALALAGWDVNRNSVDFNLGILPQGVLTVVAVSNERGYGLAAEIARVLMAEGVLAFPFVQGRPGCEEQGLAQDEINKNPWCSQVSVFVGNKPWPESK